MMHEDENVTPKIKRKQFCHIENGYFPLFPQLSQLDYSEMPAVTKSRMLQRRHVILTDAAR